MTAVPVREYLRLSTDLVTVVVKAEDRRFFPHTVNAYAGGLLMGPTPSGMKTAVDVSHPAPIPEETDITINVMANDGHTPVSVDVRGSTQKDNLIRPDVLDVTVNFRDRVGIVRVEVSCGHERFVLVLDVCPRKMGYDTDYYAMVEDLQSMSRALAYDWLRSSSFAGGRGGDAPASDIEFLSALDGELAHLSACLRTIATSPSRTIRRRPVTNRVDRITRVSDSLTRSLSRGQGSGRMLRLHGSGLHVHERVPVEGTVVSYDTPANRWLRQRLETIRNRVSRILRSESGTSTNSLYGDATVDRLKSLYMSLTIMLDQPFLRSIETPRGRSEPTMEVFGRAGYRAAAEVLERIENAFLVSEGIQLINSRPISELYEEWCYLKVATMVGELTEGAVDPREAVEVANDRLRIRFRRSRSSRIEIRSNRGDRYHVAYNMAYPTITGVQKPDIIIEIDRGHRPRTILVLDAKYRLIDKDRYGNAIRPQPPVDAINALHRYRDAIYVTMSGRKVRPVVKGVILYPPPDPVAPDNPPYWDSIAQVGIGAIPLLPGEDSRLREFLSNALNPDSPDIYKPGPSFEPYETMLTRRTRI